MSEAITNLLPDGMELTGLSAVVDYGGFLVMLLLLGLSVAALTVLIYKVFHFSWAGVGTENKKDNQAIALWSAGKHHEALDLISTRRSGRASIFAKTMEGLKTAFNDDSAKEKAETLSLRHLSGLRAHLRVLESAAQLAPLIGLFGTVIGMMGAFQELQAAGADTDPAALAGGIWVALMTTAAGLAIAIPASFALYWFDGRLLRERELLEMGLTDIFSASPKQGEMSKKSEALFHAAE